MGTHISEYPISGTDFQNVGGQHVLKRKAYFNEFLAEEYQINAFQIMIFLAKSTTQII